ncbi:hypothetical protein PHYPSEUDO_012826 [Phytophthora pseudosyringae]|uniref:Alpha-L-arabinofuranosidase B catalytic domain-containing protein n=1 Tax=Phytophthora pseudosyringae TaxID=221518 RepID=A0A8T1W7Z8_9STRA|nr:hypothetical protein PHYPSEUDO_012826 [Phytophthora pseudosyringae]
MKDGALELTLILKTVGLILIRLSFGVQITRQTWIMADLEDGVFGCADKFCSSTSTVQYPNVVAMLNGRSGGTFALEQGSAQSKPRTTALVRTATRFYEGVMVSGDLTDDNDSQIQANIVAAAYGGERLAL